MFNIIFVVYLVSVQLSVCISYSFAVPSVDDPNLNATWIYDYLADLFSEWLPEEAKVTFHQGGYYSFLYKPGFRIVSLNSALNLGENL